MTRPFTLAACAFAAPELLFHNEPLGPVADHYFDPPAPLRASALIDTLLNENVNANTWRTPRNFVSTAEWPIGNAPQVRDSDTGAERDQHNRLVSASFALHPLYGCGHALRTDGRVAAFWNGERTYVVHITNLKFIAVKQNSRGCEPKARSSGPKALPAHVRAALEQD